jgi:ABC-type lipoprotein release transport system permease subunit
MSFRRLVLRGLAYHWRTNLAVVLGVATAVAVLAGALLVGDSVRGSLRDLVLQRLGRVDYVVISTGFFREQLAADLLANPAFAPAFSGVAPLVLVQGFVSDQESGRRAGQVRVYGVDDRFWRFHGVDTVSGPEGLDALLSPALAEQLDARVGGTVLIRVQRPLDIPLESLHGRKDDVGRTLRLDVRQIVAREALGDFALDAQQAEVRAVFVPLALLQQEIERADRVNALLLSAKPESAAGAGDVLARLVRDEAELDDVGLRLRALNGGGLAVESDAGLLTDEQVEAAQGGLTQAGAGSTPVFTYLANTLRVGDREIPYSLVTAMDSATSGEGIVLTEWAATDLGAKPGHALTMEYYVWEDPGQLVTRSTELRVERIVPTGFGDRDLAPVLPGISSSPTLSDWDPPFPIDLRRVRKVDEDYWEKFRTTPKAFLSLATGQRLWRSRYGAVTSIRIGAPAPGAEARRAQAAADSADGAPERYAAQVRARIDPLAMGVGVQAVRRDALGASRGATDFGAYFVYFSFFLVVSALLLASLFFKLGVEQRSREVGLLRAVGFGDADVRRLFMAEGLAVAVAGSAIGVLGALAYAWLLMLGLRTWWVDAVGTTALTLHVTPVSLIGGALGGIAAAMVCIWWTLRGLARVSERSLLMGQLETDIYRSAFAGPIPRSGPGSGRPTYVVYAAVGLAIAGIALIGAGAAGVAAPTGAFFGGGTALLGAALCASAALLRRRPRHGLGGHGWQPVSALGMRNATYRPGRSVLSMAVIASATFILISVDAFRRDEGVVTTDRQSGGGGYALLVETILPIAEDPNSREGRDTLNLFDLDGVTFEPFRLLPGDDASCLNLYEPRNPRILAPRDSFIAEGRFSFQASLATSDAEAANPWLLLHRRDADGAVPVIADANSMTYVLHRQLGDVMVLMRGDREIRLRLVAALRDSIFQGELMMSQANFHVLFPDQAGYRVMLVETAPGRTAEVATRIEDAMSDFGGDAISTAERLAQFHRVENTYLSTFQTLGGLGLLLGTVGLATVLLRNVLERRRELALLGAVGYRRSHFLLMAAAENTLLLAGGLLAGAACAALAITPAVMERGGRLPLTSGTALLLFAVFATGLLSSLVATRAATRAPLLDALRSE